MNSSSRPSCPTLAFDLPPLLARAIPYESYTELELQNKREEEEGYSTAKAQFTLTKILKNLGNGSIYYMDGASDASILYRAHSYLLETQGMEVLRYSGSSGNSTKTKRLRDFGAVLFLIHLELTLRDSNVNTDHRIKGSMYLN